MAEQAGLQEGITFNTMADRYNAANSLRNQGYDDETIRQITGLGMQAPSSAGLQEDSGAMGAGELVFNYGPRQFASGALEGLSGVAEDYLGAGSVSEALDDAAEYVGPTDEQQERRSIRDEERGFAGDALDAIGQEVGGVAAPIAAGMAAGSVVPGAGTLVGGIIGAVAGMARMYDQGRDNLVRAKLAEERGVDPNTISQNDIRDAQVTLNDDEKTRAAAVGMMGAIDAFPGTRVLRALRPQAVSKVAAGSIGRRMLTEAGKVGLAEGTIEVMQELGTLALTDEQLRSEIRALPEGDRMAVVDLITKTHGRDLALSFAAGVGLGGGAGAIAGGVEAKLRNDIVKDTVTKSAALAKSRNINPEQMEAIARDPVKGPVLQKGLAEISALQRRRDIAEKAYLEAPEDAKSDAKEILDNFDTALGQKIDEVYGPKGVDAPGFQTTLDVQKAKREDKDAKWEEVAERASVLNIPKPERGAVEYEATVAALDDVATKADARMKASSGVVNTRGTSVENKKLKAYNAAVEEEAEARAQYEVLTKGGSKGEIKRRAIRDIKLEDAARVAGEENQQMVDLYKQEFDEITDPEKRLKALKVEANKKASGLPKKKRDEIEAKIRKLRSEIDSGDLEPKQIRDRQNKITGFQARLGTKNPRKLAAQELLAAEEGGQTEGAQSPPSGGEAAATPSGDTAPETVEAAQAGQAPAVEAAETKAAVKEKGEASPEVRAAAAQPDITNVRQERISDYERARSEKDKAARDIAVDAILGDAGITVTPETKRAFTRGTGKVQTRLNRAAKADPNWGTVTETVTPEEAAPPPAAAPKPVPENDPRRDGDDIDRQFRWKTFIDDVDPDAGIEAHEDFLRGWTAESKKEATAVYDADGNLLGIGTNNHRNEIAIPDAAFRQPNTTVTHTHPDQTPMSAADVLQLSRMKPEGAAFRAILPDGQVTEIRVGEKGLTPDIVRSEFNSLRNVLDETIPEGLGVTAAARIKQEAFLRHLDAQGYIEYTQPMSGFNSQEESQINDAVDKAERDQGIRGDDGAGTPATEGRPDGEEGVAIAAQDAGAAARTAAGLDLARTADQEPLPGQVADPARLRDLTTPVFLAAKNKPKGPGRPEALPKLVQSGELTQPNMDRGLSYAASAISFEGTQASTIVLQAARIMFPKAKLDPSTFTKLKKLTKKGKTYTELDLDPQWSERLNAAWQMLRRVGQEEGMALDVEMMPFKRNNGMWGVTKHFMMSQDLQDYLQVSPPQSTLFTRPMQDPDNTDDIVRHADTNVFSPEAIDRMRATARYLQRNTYYIDQDALAALTPDDLISDKKLGENLIKKDADGNLQFSDDPVKREDQEKFLKVQRFRQGKKLAMLRRMAETHGAQPIGFRYRVDDKGRIYADGAFTPQTGDYVKAILRVGAPDGPKLKDMPTVDHSASGWQVATLMTRDKTASGWFNLGRHDGENMDLAFQEGYSKRDMYDRLMADLKAEIIRDAESSPNQKKQKLAKLFKEKVFDPDLAFAKPQIKPAVIAVNYAGGRANFQQRLIDVYGSTFDGVPPGAKDGLWGYTSAAAYDQLRAKAPAVMRFQDWAIDSLKQLVSQVDGNKDPLRDKPSLQFSVGLDGKYAKIKPVEKKITVRASQNITGEDGKKITDVAEQEVEVPTNVVDAAATARSIFSQIIQGFDASILHRAIDIYKQNGDDFVTSNHDSYTVPEGNAGRMAAAIREAMKQIMQESGDVPARLRDEIKAQADAAGVTIEGLDNPEVFNDDGSFRSGGYDLNELDSSVPVFVENYGDIPPAYTDLQGNPIAGAPAAENIARGIDFEASDTGVRTGVALDTSLPKMAQFAQDSQFPNMREFKLAMQQKALATQEGQVDLRQNTPEAAERLIDFLTEDARAALVNNRNAIGWYDRTVTEAMDILAEVHPEIATDPEARFKYIWALAVTSNGQKVDKNFELAEVAYNRQKNSGVFPTDLKAGQTTKNINDGLAMYHVLVDRLGSWEAARDFMVERQPVRDIERISGISVSKEGKGTVLPGAVILGPKIGGGFFSNLYGNFNELTMDRWFTRTLGRWRGNLIESNPKMLEEKRRQLRDAIRGLDANTLRGLRKMVDVPVRKTMSKKLLDDLSMSIAQKSAKIPWREEINNLPGGADVRKIANMHAKYLDGQKEDPGGSVDRNFIRDVFNRGLDILRSEYDMPDLTMADLQALLWYPEKRLYDTAVKPEGQEATGYEAEEAPDYANAARKLRDRRLGRTGQTGAGPGPSGAGAEPSFSPPLRDANVARAIDADGGEGGVSRGTAADSALAVTRVGERELPGDVQEVDAASYDEAMDAATPFMGDFAAQVSRVPSDPSIRRYVLDDGYSGFAIDGDNIIGVFSSPGSGYTGAAGRILQAAIAAGGRRLDGFDTFLPKIYAEHGFRAVARLPFNREYAPSVDSMYPAAGNWNYEAMTPWNNGEPDVVFMVYDPENASPDTDVRITDYEEGAEIQSSELDTIETRAAATAEGRGGASELSGQAVRGEQAANVARGVDEWLGKKPGVTDAQIESEITYAYESGRTSASAAMAHLRHSPLFSYDRIMNDATRVDGKDYGPEFMDAHANFTRGMQSELSRLSRSKQPIVAAAYLDMAADQRRDHQKKLIMGIERGTIEVSDVDPQTKIFKSREPVRSANVAKAIDAPEGIDLGTRERSGAREVFNAATDVAKNPLRHTRTLLEKVEDNFFNRFAPIRRLEIQQKGQLAEGMESAFKAVETAVNDSGRNEALLYYGAAKMGAHNEFATAEGTVGLKTIFDKAAEGAADKGQAMADWMGYMVGRRILELRKSGFKGIFPMSDTEAQKYVAAATPQQVEAADMWKKHNDANIDFLVASGRISKDQAQAMKDLGSYVPMYRSQKNTDGTSPELELPKFKRGSGGEILSRDPGIKALKGGGKKAIDNIMINMVRNSQAIVAAGMRNKAANLAFDLMIDAGAAVPVKGSPSKKPSADAVAVWRNGKKKWVKPLPGSEHLVTALAGLQPLQLGRIGGMLAGIGGIFRQGITLSPAFMVRNLIRGAVANGLLTSGGNLTAANNTLTGLRDAYNNGAATRAFKAQSGMGDYGFGNPTTQIGKDDILIEYGLQPKTIGYRIRRAIEAAEKVGTATELADRVAAYKTMIERGMRPDEAAYQARAIMDYARKGSLPELRAWLPTVPFLNARLQGFSRLTEGAVGRGGAGSRGQALKQLALNGLVLTALSGAIWARNAFDEEREERYKAEPLWKRLNYHIVYLGDKTVLIPKAFELGHIFSSVPELFADAMVNDMNEIGPGVKKIAADTIGFNLIPAAALPIIEANANYSYFTGRPLEGMREQNLRAADRVQGASALSKFVGQQLGISDATKVSPTMIEHWMQGYGGTYFLTMAGVIDVVASETGLGAAPVGGAFGDVPVLSSAMQRSFGSMLNITEQKGTKYMEEFYNNKGYITQIYRSAKDASARGDVEYAQRLLADAPATPRAYKVVNKAASQLSDLNRAIRDIQANTAMTPRQKRVKIEPLVQARNKLVAQVSGIIRSLEEKQGTTFKSAA